MATITGSAVREHKPEVPFMADTCPLIVVRPDGSILCTNNKGEKERAVKDEANAEAVFLTAWPGNWRTDVFVMERAALLADVVLK